MGIFNDWNQMIDKLDEQTAPAFQEEYYTKEEKVYKDILAKPEEVISGKLSDLAERYAFTNPMFAGFMEGINDSLKTSYDLPKLKINSAIKLDVDFEKLYFNMLEAKASWLYQLPEWDGVLTQERRHEIQKEHRLSKQAVSHKIDRNAPCPCGSGKKYKKCCGRAV